MHVPPSLSDHSSNAEACTMFLVFDASSEVEAGPGWMLTMSHDSKCVGLALGA
ncbi:MAG: hypothetical protein AAGG01_02525 [Planctomycetota bacterium]